MLEPHTRDTKIHRLLTRGLAEHLYLSQHGNKLFVVTSTHGQRDRIFLFNRPG